jgi:sugar phosphate isomerase/epimerase
VIDRIETVHAADTAKKGALMPTVIGEGIVPFERIFDRLKKNGWDGWVCIEEASGTGVSGVLKAIEFVRGTWASV